MRAAIEAQMGRVKLDMWPSETITVLLLVASSILKETHSLGVTTNISSVSITVNEVRSSV
jgi:hypothetical protein